MTDVKGIPADVMERAWPMKQVRIVLERRPDGGLRVHSPDVLGLILSHNDADKVMTDILPALESIWGHRAQS